MKQLSKAVLLVSALALSACANANRFDNDAGGTGGPGVNDLGSSALDSQPLPDTPEYFQDIVGDRVLFSVDQSTLTTEAQGILSKQAQWLLTNSDYLALIEGHADEQGTREYNIALGASRSNSVKEYLVSQGVPASRIRTVSYGKERPAEVCSAESCYAKNRRAVTVISIGTGF